MCGIAGFVGKGGQAALDQMLDAMTYRGPDDRGTWHDGQNCFLGQLRLSIIDLADGYQPMISLDGQIVVIFNGEIYNHRMLRRELEALGHQFQTNHSDTEVLIHGYRQWGKKLVNKLNGMWAFALLDKKEGTLWLCRDRFGKKPLYFAQVGESLIFSSELSSLSKHPSVSNQLDSRALMKYFGHGYVPAPATMLKGVKKLPAGHWGVFSLGAKTFHQERYWRYKITPDQAWLQKQKELEEALIEKLFNAVRYRLQADVPVGVFLSGGIDSSSIAALALTVGKSRPVRTYSIGFEEESFDETPYSDEMAGVLGTQHTSEILSAGKCIELLDTIYGRLDEPMADASLVPSFLMCQLASRDVKVALGGDGADELFAGYDPFKAISFARYYGRGMPRPFHEALLMLVNQLPVSHKNMSLDFKIKKFLSGAIQHPSLRNPIWLGPLPPGQLGSLFGAEVDTEDLYEEAIDAWDQASGSEIDKTLQFYTELYLQDDILTKMDRAGMLNSLEVRSPFLDIEVVDLARTIPAQLKFQNRQTKYILKNALAAVLPVDILYRSKKGFGIPIGQWFKNQVIEIDPDALDGFVDTNKVKKLYQDHLKGKADWRAFLWSHFVVERWMNRLSSSDLQA